MPIELILIPLGLCHSYLNMVYSHRQYHNSQLLLLICLLLGISSVDAGIKCWRTASNGRECGYQVPVKYLNTRIEVINNNGMVVRIIEAKKNKQQLAAEAKRKQAEKKIAARKRKDRILLLTYTTERDLLIARDNRIAALQGLIDITESNNNNVRFNLAQLRERAANYERSGKEVPKNLLTKIKNNGSQIKNNSAYITKRRIDVKHITKNYANDLKRFRHLKNIQKKEYEGG